jgi:multiple sugar transport system permease protein
VGLHNYRLALGDPIFRTALRNNFLFAVSVPVQLVVPLGLAYLIHERIPGWRIFRATFFLPAVLATVVVGTLAQIILQLDGPLNALLGAIGLGGVERNWLASATTSIPMIVLVVVWANFGYSVLIYLAGLSSLDPELGEAARLDGANRLQILRYVYVPNLRRVMELVLVVNTITAFAYMFTFIFVITNGGPGFDTYVTEYYVYNQAFTFNNMGYASAIGVLMTLLVAVIGFFQIRVLTGAKTG